MSPEEHPSSQRRIFTVSELTGAIKALLEDAFPFIWVAGEMSNVRVPSSGHCYFSLKDDSAQISAVMFRGNLRNVKFRLTDGLDVMGIGRLSLYPPRGAYQVIFEHLEPKGLGSLQLAVEQLKNRLAAEGVFDPARKRPIPFLPKKISVVTSPTGAVVHDILTTITRRFPDRHVEIVPVAVQGEAAPAEIAAAFQLLNGRPDTEVIILARGGGSLEDLAAFNSEMVARAVIGSRVPVVSAVGHETDTTICDWVADLRAPTPTAAAELVLPRATDLTAMISHHTRALTAAMTGILDDHRRRVLAARQILERPRTRLDDRRLHLGMITDRLSRTLQSNLTHQREALAWRCRQLAAVQPVRQVQRLKSSLEALINNLLLNHDKLLTRRSAALDGLSRTLNALSPVAVLDRGYSITRRAVDGRLVTDPGHVHSGDRLTIQVARGHIPAVVERTSHASEKERKTETNL